MRNLPRLVADNREFEGASGNLVNILNPLAMRLYGVCRETNELDTTLLKLRLKLGKCSELGGANRGEVFVNVSGGARVWGGRILPSG